MAVNMNVPLLPMLSVLDLPPLPPLPQLNFQDNAIADLMQQAMMMPTMLDSVNGGFQRSKVFSVLGPDSSKRKDTCTDDFMVTDIQAQRQQFNLKYEKRRQFGKLSQNKGVNEVMKNKFKPSAHTKQLVQAMQDKLE